MKGEIAAFMKAMQDFACTFSAIKYSPAPVSLLVPVYADYLVNVLTLQDLCLFFPFSNFLQLELFIHCFGSGENEVCFNAEHLRKGHLLRF